MFWCFTNQYISQVNTPTTNTVTTPCLRRVYDLTYPMRLDLPSQCFDLFTNCRIFSSYNNKVQNTCRNITIFWSVHKLLCCQIPHTFKGDFNSTERKLKRRAVTKRNHFPCKFMIKWVPLWSFLKLHLNSQIIVDRPVFAHHFYRNLIRIHTNYNLG